MQLSINALQMAPGWHRPMAETSWQYQNSGHLLWHVSARCVV